MTYLELIGFGEGGWGYALLIATRMTLLVSICGFALGSVLGGLITAAKASRSTVLRGVADAYTTIMRGIPDLLVLYLFYFGGSNVLGFLGQQFGSSGFIGMPAFATGVLAIGAISAAYQSEVFRGAFQALDQREIEAGRAYGMTGWLLFRRIVLPQVLRLALPPLGNVWQGALKESALVSVTGLVEVLRQASIGAGSTLRAFEFYLTAAAIYLFLAAASTLLFSRAEIRLNRHLVGTR